MNSIIIFFYQRFSRYFFLLILDEVFKNDKNILKGQSKNFKPKNTKNDRIRFFDFDTFFVIKNLNLDFFKDSDGILRLVLVTIFLDNKDFLKVVFMEVL